VVIYFSISPGHPFLLVGESGFHHHAKLFGPSGALHFEGKFFWGLDFQTT